MGCRGAARVLLTGMDAVAIPVNNVAAAGTDPPLFDDMRERRERHSSEVTLIAIYTQINKPPWEGRRCESTRNLKPTHARFEPRRLLTAGGSRSRSGSGRRRSC